MNSEPEQIFASFPRSGKSGLTTRPAVITVDAPNAPTLPRADKQRKDFALICRSWVNHVIAGVGKKPLLSVVTPIAIDFCGAAFGAVHVRLRNLIYAKI